MILNLANSLHSHLKYKITQYPDGQQDILILNKVEKKEWTIFSRFNSFKDLELILLATKALRRLGIKEISLNIPYLLGARSDRQFQEGGTSYLVDIIAPIINAQNYESVLVLDVHSDVAAACIDNLILTPNHDLFIHFAALNFGRKYTLVSPDAGSLKKIYSLAERIKLECPQDEFDIITCTKHRDIKTGKILSTEVPCPNYVNDLADGYKRTFVIVDDICDGGRTFIEIAKVIKENYTHLASIYLVVTHGIFSAGFVELEKYFDGIYCTNSMQNHVYKVNGYPEDYNQYKCNFKQLNIF